MNKKTGFKIIFLVLLGIGFYWFNQTFTPILTAESAVKQLEDSAFSYGEFKLAQKLPLFLTLGYLVIAVLLFIKQIMNLFRSEKNEEK